jgi:hypothetical protein
MATKIQNCLNVYQNVHKKYQISLKFTKMATEIPNILKVYQNGHKNTNWPYSIPKWQWKYQMAVK